MSRIPAAGRTSRLARTAVVAVAASAATFALTFPGAASALVASHHGSHHAKAVPAPPANPTKANQIQNIDQVKTAIKAYYGDRTTTEPDPVDGKTMLHRFSPNSSYAKETKGIARNIQTYLAHKAKHRAKAKKALLLDVDDTTLNTYPYEIYSNFVYDPATNASFVNAGVFHAVPGMPHLVTWAKSHGYTIFYLTGRPEAQRPGTVANLGTQGYPKFAPKKLYLKDYDSEPWLHSCAPSCTTIQYKSLTRKHIESLGYDIVANAGDQYSDLKGGHADRRFKMPNPMYYLP